MEQLNYFSAFIIGLLSGAHCIGMCGGIMSAFTLAIPKQQHNNRRILAILLSYNLARILSYGVIAAILGSIAAVANETYNNIAYVLRLLSGLMLIAMGLYLANWWRGLTYLEQAGNMFWQYIKPLGQRCMPVTNVRRAFVLGSVWGWLPCGLVYSMLTMAISQANTLQSVLTMLSFGLGTLPAVISTGFVAQQMTRFIQQRSIRLSAASLIILFGLWTLIGTEMYSSNQHLHGGEVIPMDESINMHTHH